MKKQKITLSDLKVSSFTTSEESLIVGGIDEETCVCSGGNTCTAGGDWYCPGGGMQIQ